MTEEVLQINEDVSQMSDMETSGTAASGDCPRCDWCGMFHRFKCPMVKSLEYNEGNGRLKRVEFFAPHDFPKMKARQR